MALSRRKHAYFDFTSGAPTVLFTTSTGAVSAVTKDLNYGGYVDGNKYLEMTAKANNFGTAPIIVPAANGYAIQSPATAQADNVQASSGVVSGMCPSFTVGTDPAFFARAKFKAVTQNKNDLCVVGFRTLAAYATTGAATAAGFGTSYNDMAFAGVVDTSAAGAVGAITRVAGASNTLTVATKAAIGAAEVFEIKVLVSATGVVTWLVNNAADTLLSALNVTLSGTPVLIPTFIMSVHGAAATDWAVQEFEYGHQ